VDDWADDLKKWCDYFDIELMASIWSAIQDALSFSTQIGLKALRNLGSRAAVLALKTASQL
jgi:hypothetical protein